ncbi:MAG TPA: hypothetical protein VKG92_08190 [Flavobacteriales bacterium]|nr:hypothetical protein [Flavobacteriales bacterium]
MSNIIHQKLIAACDAIPLRTGAHETMHVLYLPEDEIHELGLLYLNYLLRAKGERTVYLGAERAYRGPSPTHNAEHSTDHLHHTSHHPASTIAGASFLENAEGDPAGKADHLWDGRCSSVAGVHDGNTGRYEALPNPAPIDIDDRRGLSDLTAAPSPGS